MKGIVFDIQRFSIHDGPGIRTTVFLKGCRLNCRWCQNPEGIAAKSSLVYWEGKCSRCGECVPVCHHHALELSSQGISIDDDSCVLCGACCDVCPDDALTIVGDEMTVDEVTDVVKRDRVFYETSGGGVTLSGGDPLVQSEFAAAVLEACRSEGLHTAVESALCCDWDDVERVLPHTDLFLMDLKLMDASLHKQWTGRDNVLIKQNFKKICQTDIKKVVRVALIPELTATEENLRAIAEYVQSVDPGIPVELLNFNPLCKSKYDRLGRDYYSSNPASFTAEEMSEFRKIVGESGCKLYSQPEKS